MSAEEPSSFVNTSCVVHPWESCLLCKCMLKHYSGELPHPSQPQLYGILENLNVSNLSSLRKVVSEKSSSKGSGSDPTSSCLLKIVWVILCFLFVQHRVIRMLWFGWQLFCVFSSCNSSHQLMLPCQDLFPFSATLLLVLICCCVVQQPLVSVSSHNAKQLR